MQSLTQAEGAKYFQTYPPPPSQPCSAARLESSPRHRSTLHHCWGREGQRLLAPICIRRHRGVELYRYTLQCAVCRTWQFFEKHNHCLVLRMYNCNCLVNAKYRMAALVNLRTTPDGTCLFDKISKASFSTRNTRQSTQLG